MIFVYILLGFLGVVVILLLIAFVHSQMIKDKNTTSQPLPVDKAYADILGKRFSKMIQVKTYSYTREKDNIIPFHQLHKEMETLFPNVFSHLRKTEFEGGSLLLKWRGKNSDKPMVLMAHQDVVPASKADWTYEPFSGKVTEDEVYGRGTLDTKNTLFAFYQAVEELLEEGFKPEQDIYLSSSTDEEISGFGAEAAVEYLQKNKIEPYIVLDEGGAIVSGALPSVKRPLALVGVLEKGYLNLKFTAKSRGGHSSTPPKHTPIARLAEFIHDVEKKFPLKTKMIPEVQELFENAAPSMNGTYRFLFGNMWLFKPLITWLLPKINPYGRALLSTTIAFTMQQGSEAANVIPSEAFVLCNLRTHPIQNISDSLNVMQKIANKYDIETEIVEGREASPISDTEGETYKYLTSQIKAAYPDVQITPYIMLGGTDARFFSEITKSAFRFSPVRMTNEELKKIHGKDESIQKTALAEAVYFYKQFIINHK
ncbi:MAG: M20/M25/M40 family metallo-hydrolase [Bacilli bacterium]|nr:M20/M25/M40 family metallo-hydrolase [Bacilli bacterium]MBN2877429.1 M20/M25/M40 family metallo-hydrolase [Bacilli bacterium]